MLAVPLAIIIMASKAGAKKQAQKIVSGEIQATEIEINKLIDRMKGVGDKNLSEEDSDIIERLREIKNAKRSGV